MITSISFFFTSPNASRIQLSHRHPSPTHHPATHHSPSLIASSHFQQKATMTSLIPPPSFLYGIIISLTSYPILLHYISPLLISKYATTSLRQKVNSYDHVKSYQFHSMLPSVIHALIQIVGVATVVLWGREGFDGEGGRASIVEFDERTFVPYGVRFVNIAIYLL